MKEIILTDPFLIGDSWEYSWFDNALNQWLLYKDSFFYVLKCDSQNPSPELFYNIDSIPSNILTGKLSLESNFIALHINNINVLVVDIINKKKWIIEIKSSSENIIHIDGILWSNHGGNSEDLIILTAKGIELYKISHQRVQCKLSRYISQPSFCFWYEPSHRFLMIGSKQKLSRDYLNASYYQKSMINIDGFFLKIEKSSIPKIELPPPEKVPRFEIGPRTDTDEIFLFSLYGNIYFFVKYNEENQDYLSVYMISKSKIDRICSICLTGWNKSSLKCSVVDNLLLCHNVENHSSYIFDIKSAQRQTGLGSLHSLLYPIVEKPCPLLFTHTLTKQAGGKLALGKVNRHVHDDVGHGYSENRKPRTSLSQSLHKEPHHIENIHSLFFRYNSEIYSIRDFEKVCDEEFFHPNFKDDLIMTENMDRFQFRHAGHYQFLQEDHLFDSSQRVFWSIQLNLQALVMSIPEARIQIEFLLRRGIQFRYVLQSTKGLIDHSCIKKESIQAKQLLFICLKTYLMQREDSGHEINSIFSALLKGYFNDTKRNSFRQHLASNSMDTEMDMIEEYNSLSFSATSSHGTRPRSHSGSSLSLSLHAQDLALSDIRLSIEDNDSLVKTSSSSSLSSAQTSTDQSSSKSDLGSSTVLPKRKSLLADGLLSSSKSLYRRHSALLHLDSTGSNKVDPENKAQQDTKYSPLSDPLEQIDPICSCLDMSAIPSLFTLGDFQVADTLNLHKLEPGSNSTSSEYQISQINAQGDSNQGCISQEDCSPQVSSQEADLGNPRFEQPTSKNLLQAPQYRNQSFYSLISAYSPLLTKDKIQSKNILLSLRRDAFGHLIVTQSELLAYLWLPMLVYHKEVDPKIVAGALHYCISLLREIPEVYLLPDICLLFVNLLIQTMNFFELSTLLKMSFFPDSLELAYSLLDFVGHLRTVIEVSKSGQRFHRLYFSEDIFELYKLENSRQQLLSSSLDMLWRLNEKWPLVRWYLSQGDIFSVLSICESPDNDDWIESLSPGTFLGNDIFESAVLAIENMDKSLENSMIEKLEYEKLRTGGIVDAGKQRFIDRQISQQKETISFRKVSLFYQIYSLIKRWDPACLYKSKDCGSSRLAQTHAFPVGHFPAVEENVFKDLFGY